MNGQSQGQFPEVWIYTWPPSPQWQWRWLQHPLPPLPPHTHIHTYAHTQQSSRSLGSCSFTVMQMWMSCVTNKWYRVIIGRHLDSLGLQRFITLSAPRDQKHALLNKSTPECEMAFKAWLFSNTTWLEECLVAGGESPYIAQSMYCRLFYLTIPSLFLIVPACRQFSKEVWNLELTSLISIPTTSISSCQGPAHVFAVEESPCLSQGHSALSRPALTANTWGMGHRWPKSPNLGHISVISKGQLGNLVLLIEEVGQATPKPDWVWLYKDNIN